MARESQSKNKETRAIYEVDKGITRIENVFSGMICYKGHNQMLVFQQQ